MTEGTAAPDRAWLMDRVARMIDEGESPGPDESLILYGLDSIRVMELVGALEGLGIRASFQELVERPTIDAWWALIEARRPQAAEA